MTSHDDSTPPEEFPDEHLRRAVDARLGTPEQLSLPLVMPAPLPTEPD